jgi:hypothetical protein
MINLNSKFKKHKIFYFFNKPNIPLALLFVITCPSLLLLTQHPSERMLCSSVVVDKASFDKLLVDDVKETDDDDDDDDLTGDTVLFGKKTGATGNAGTTNLGSGSH